MGREAELPFRLAQENFDPSQNLSILVEKHCTKTEPRLEFGLFCPAYIIDICNLL